MLLSPELQQRVADLRLGITNAPANVVANERLHLLDLFKVIDLQAGEIKRLEAELADTETIEPAPVQ
jgi:hypothetical protein